MYSGTSVIQSMCKQGVPVVTSGLPVTPNL
jgi:hypothetical protein